jgi:hypothetical protein
VKRAYCSSGALCSASQPPVALAWPLLADFWHAGMASMLLPYMPWQQPLADTCIYYYTV